MSVTASRDGPVALVTIEGAKGLNVFDRATMTAFRDELRTLAEDTSLRVVVVTGAGERAFSAGADIDYMLSVDVEQGAAWGALGHEVCHLLETMPHVTIAALNGIAVGGGCEVALSCDLRYASAAARLGQPEVNIGIFPGWGGTQRLARVTTLGFAKDLILTGRFVDASEALQRGLVDGVHDPVLDHALDVARQIAEKSPAALRAAKDLCNIALQGIHAANLQEEAARFAELVVGPDAKEGMAAFREKRPAHYDSN